MIEDFENKIRQTIEYLPPIPIIMAELIQALKNDDVELNALGRIISKDPSMSLNVLKVANSAFYGLRNKVATIEHAVRMLGTREITSLCIACSTWNALRPSPKEQTIDLALFWRHSVATGVFAKLLADELNIGLLNSIYLAGLMHDVGKIVLDKFAHDEYMDVLRLTYNEGVPALEAERQVMGASHDMVGSWLMEKWQLPHVFSQVANYHHSVFEAPEALRVPVSIVSFADHLAKFKSFGFGGDTGGVVLKDTDAFRALERINPVVRGLDFVDFISSLDQAGEDIVELEQAISR
ncbi:HDOD domain-containing protein [Syntrophorhabdus aromaticivorans]|uniref:HDOD domain-containing protein n=1 Tax=Syntrophorhabdus aromaticivorans TaxID=328301 RepID=A0A351U1M2_9BACT|nr:HDOD domain-containing protein [Syntrophorhabdus aromaticivorans]NLW34678.1 HDOD domain-containing protein [Syntrophorhabdus aromaticivorans]HBA53853.1 HDOD domain-containing protein [Syntrophorhabdus aromaticivorans]